MSLPLAPVSRRSVALMGAGLLALAAFGPSGAAAQDRKTAEEAQALVEQAIAHYQDVGQDQAFQDFNDAGGPFVDGELYVIVCTMEGIYKTHAHNGALIDNDILWDIQDVNGVYPVRRIVESATDAPDGGWIDYVWVNPTNEALENKRVYVAAHDGMAFAVGYYEAN